MITKIAFRNIDVRVKDEGNGDVVVLLHGYLESLEIWNGFAAGLAKNYRVVSIDIPGHGQSGILGKIHDMSLLATCIHEVLESMDINRFVLVGHSMGGYVSLSYLADYPEKLAGICLFHSSPFADTDEKKASRAKEIGLIRKGKLNLICNYSIPNGFADDHPDVMADKIEFAKEIAKKTPPEGAIAILEGMRLRPDRQELLLNNKRPVLFILGKKDNFISFDALYPLVKSYPCITVSVLENSGHSGYLEETEKSLEYIKTFLASSFGPLK